MDAPVAIVGAGMMGRQIALTLATAGTEVRLHDLSPAALAAALERMRAEAREAEEGGELPRAVAAAARVRPVADLAEAVAGAWLVIEAIPERLDLKRALFTELSALAAPATILATNSSSLRSALLADLTAHPARLMNAHFYGLPWRRPAVELMTCGQTAEANLERVAAFFRACGLFPVVARQESTGFVFNRIWHAIKRECLQIVAEGVATPAEVDGLWRIVMGAEPQLGPFARMDRVGLDVVLDIERRYAAESGRPADEPPVFLAEMVERGELGRKSGKGFYEYGNDVRPSCGDEDP